MGGSTGLHVRADSLQCSLHDCNMVAGRAVSGTGPGPRELRALSQQKVKAVKGTARGVWGGFPCVGSLHPLPSPAHRAERQRSHCQQPARAGEGQNLSCELGLQV